ncbi:MAG TPA: hypothetical protein VMD48_05820 [Solirubrobacteraceae bacterium]|nr:hypothetical protein [Solirubrobacteraceae bacterium]
MKTSVYGVLVPLTVVLLAWQWQWPSLRPAPGFDESWTAGLAMAVHNGLVFGERVVFTYGPLGFLSTGSLWHLHLAQASVAYTFLLRFGLALGVFANARRTFGALVAFLIALVVASVDALLLEPVVLLIAAVWALTADLTERRAIAYSAAAGAFAGLELLNKVSVGVSLVALTAVFVLSLGGRRWACVAAALAGWAGSLLIVWTVVGQPVGALPDYFLNSARITLGYGPAVGVEAPGLGWQYPAAFAGLALGVWAAWQSTAQLDRARRWGVVALWIVFWFFAFKEGFVRHDPEHDVSFFGPLLGGFLAFRWRGRSRLIALVGIAVLVVFALQAATSSLTQALDPTRDVSIAFDQVRDVLSGKRSAALVAAGRAQIESAEPITPEALSLLRAHTVDVWPSEIALAWAYGLDWDPLPVLQSYSAYTTALDELDAASLASSHAPQRILFVGGPDSDADNRVVSFDEGITSRGILCRYREIYASGDMAVLAHGANRCSQPVLFATVKAGWGQQVRIPSPPTSHSLVSVKIYGVGISGWESIESFFYKPAERFVRLDDGQDHRLVPGTATDGLPLRASPGVDYPAPFNIAADAQTIAVIKAGTSSGGGRPITYAFYTETVAPSHS